VEAPCVKLLDNVPRAYRAPRNIQGPT
jgi:hypothetical protein